MKVEAVKKLWEGTNQYGPTYLVAATFEGKEYKGFVKHVPKVGDDLEVEFFQEEYKGEMQDNFKILSKKAQDNKVSEMAIKTEIAQWGQALNRKLDLIMEKLEVKDHKAEVEAIRNQPVIESPFDGNMAGTNADEEDVSF